jgi:leucyl aminopeptidase
MRFILLLVLLCVVYGGDVRKIQFNESHTVWIPEEDIKKLTESSPPVHFMDITDYPEPIKANIKQLYIPVIPTHQAVVRPLLQEVDANNIYLLIGGLSSYQTRYYTSPSGVEAVQWWAQQYRAYAGSRGDIDVEVYSHQPTWPQPSVIARITGTTSPNEIVILGGHIDSTASGGSAPGADDDASGSSTVLEVFRVIVDSGIRPERTIEFHAYAAEEAGLRGSQAIANYYASINADVVAMLQFDMTGYVRTGTTRTIGVVTDFTTPAVSNFIRACIDEYLDTVSWTNTACGYACSDHASWFRAGYSDGFVFESIFANSNPYIHTPNDLLDRLDTNHCADFSKLGVAFAVELSYRE